MGRPHVPDDHDKISPAESARIMALATDVRPDENVHGDPHAGAPPVAPGRAMTAAESARTMALASDIRPLENIHPDEPDAD